MANLAFSTALSDGRPLVPSPFRPVSVFDEAFPPIAMTGLLTFQVKHPIGYPDVLGGDIVSVDFDQRSPDRDGLYLMVDDTGAGSPIVRRFTRTPAGWTVESSGQSLVYDATRAAFRVAGRVIEVYRSTSVMRRDH